MELFFEAILDLIISGSIEASKSKKIPKWLRIILILFISLFFISVISLIIFVGISIIKENLLGGLFIILIGILMLILSILKFRKIYLKKK